MVGSHLSFYNKYSVLRCTNMYNKRDSQNIERVRDIWWTIKQLREVWMKMGLEKVDTHKGISVKALLDSRVMGLFMSKKLTEREGF